MDNVNYLTQLSTDPEKGLTNEQVKVNRLKFGANERMVFESKTCWEFLEEPLGDTMIQILLVAAVVALIIGLIEKHGDIAGALEGIAIMFAVAIVVLVSAANDWSKEQEFRKLQEV